MVRRRLVAQVFGLRPRVVVALTAAVPVARRMIKVLPLHCGSESRDKHVLNQNETTKRVARK